MHVERRDPVYIRSIDQRPLEITDAHILARARPSLTQAADFTELTTS
jgi:hypothetical protein